MARLPGGEKINVYVQELLCPLHGKFRALPDFLLPHKHYVVDVIEEALAFPVEGKSVDKFCSLWGLFDSSAPTRWIRAFKRRLGSIAQFAERRLSGLCPEWRAHDPPGRAYTWSYAYVWNLLGHLQQACTTAGFSAPSRAHFVFLV
jgi:hypothetical protein